jgi:protein arginine kinase activator
MICQMCNKAEATVHLTQVVGGKSKKLDLCSDCAEQCGVDDPAGFSMIEILKKFSGVFGPEEPATQVAVKQPSLRCPVCGYTELDMSKTGRVGCPSCYITFEKGLEKALKTMHRGTRHVGKHPQHIPLDGPPLPEVEKETDAKPPVRKRVRPAAQKKTTPVKEAEVAKTEQTQHTPKEERTLLQGLLESKEGMLEEAIEVENYEYAAKIRDEIKELKEQLEKLPQSEEKDK